MTGRINLRRQTGFSLIELLVALALSIFLIAGVVVMYMSTSQSYNVQQQTAQLQERERLAATFIGGVVQSAGYYASPLTYYPENAFPADSTFGTDGQALYGTSGSVGGNETDMIDVRMLTGPDTPAPGDPVLNCLGFKNNLANNQLYENEIFLNPDTQEVECTLVRPGVDSQTQPLLSGVTSLQFLYGVDTNGDGSTDQYVTADNVSNWFEVRSVRMTLGLTSKNPATGLPTPATTTVAFSAVFPIRPTVQ